MIPIRVATVGGDLMLEARVASELTHRRDAELLLRCVDRVELLAAVRGAGIDALIVAGHPPWLDLQSVSESAARGIRIIGLSDGEAPLGATSVLGTDAAIDEILEACRNAAPAEPASQRAPDRTGRLVAVWGPKGSPGRTRVAIELAYEIEDAGRPCMLLDADPFGGDVIQTVGIVDELPTVVWAARLAAQGDFEEEQVLRYLRKPEGGPIVVPGLPRGDLWADVSRFGFKELLAAARGLAKHTIVDVGFCLEPGPPNIDAGDGRNRMTRTAVQEADNVVAVGRADPLGLKNFLWAFESLTNLVDPDRVSVVANRVAEGDERRVADILKRHTGKRPVAYLPDVPSLASAAVEKGEPISTMRGAGDYRAAVQSLAITVGARLRPKGVLTKLARASR